MPYPQNESPSQRFRFEQYFRLLSENNIQVTVQSFLGLKGWSIIFKSGNAIWKAAFVFLGYARRLYTIFKAPFFDMIFIHREATPLGPPILEWVLARVLRKRIIYDFDDAIWLSDKVGESAFVNFLKWRRKVRKICRWSYRVSCGNAFLVEYAKKYSSNVILNPTTIDTKGWHNPNKFGKSRTNANHIVIGWTGSHSTLKYLEESAEILTQIEHKFPRVQFMVIADRRPDLRLSNLLFVPWRSESEIQDLMSFDIGIMPLPNDKWAQGKCGFKALQYMALKIPAIASPVGVNNQIIDHGINGFLCSTSDEWLSALTMLIKDESLRQQIGERGRNKVIDHYSVESNTSLFLKLFE